MDVTKNDKLTDFLNYGFNYGCKKFYSAGRECLHFDETACLLQILKETEPEGPLL